jgi:hypothetical protein
MDDLQLWAADEQKHFAYYDICSSSNHTVNQHKTSIFHNGIRPPGEHRKGGHIGVSLMRVKKL